MSRPGDAAKEVRRLLRERPELAERLLVLAQPPPKSARVVAPADVYAQVSPHLLGLAEERVVLLCLNRRGFPLSCEVLTVGSDRVSVIDTRHVFCRALRVGPSGAASIVLAHNHPSGDVTPSPQDIAVTRRVVAAGDVVGVELLDHLIVAGPGLWHSMRRNGDVEFSDQGVLPMSWTGK